MIARPCRDCIYAYDSFYPEFDENKTENKDSVIFSLEIDPLGNVIGILSVSTTSTQPQTITAYTPVGSVIPTAYNENTKHYSNIGTYSEALMRSLTFIKDLNQESCLGYYNFEEEGSIFE